MQCRISFFNVYVNKRRNGRDLTYRLYVINNFMTLISIITTSLTGSEMIAAPTQLYKTVSTF